MQLGITVRDRITGFHGIVTGHCNYISGCAQALVMPTVDETGKFQEGHWFDVQRLEVINAEPIVLDNSETPGPDQAAPVR